MSQREIERTLIITNDNFQVNEEMSFVQIITKVYFLMVFLPFYLENLDQCDIFQYHKYKR